METNETKSMICGRVLAWLADGKITEAQAIEQLEALEVPGDRIAEMIHIAQGGSDVVLED